MREKKKLISLIEFINSVKPSDDAYYQIKEYSDFMSRDLNIGMFVPAVFEGGKWVVLEDEKEPHDVHDPYYAQDFCRFKQYQQAKDNILFDGFVYDEEMEVVRGDWNLDIFYTDGRDINNKTIQDLIRYNPPLTAQGQKQSGL